MTSKHPGESERFNSWINQTSSVIGVLSAAITVILTVQNANIQNQIEQAKVQIEHKKFELEKQIQERTQQLEVSKERTGRYIFVRDLLPKVADQDPGQRQLTINLINLSLAPDEAARLFQGLSNSQETQLAEFGKAGLKEVQRNQNLTKNVAAKEREGFEALINGDDSKAIDFFEKANEIYPGYHSVFEISDLLRREQQLKHLQNPQTRKLVIQKILSDYTWKVPADLVSRLEQSVKN